MYSFKIVIFFAICNFSLGYLSFFKNFQPETTISFETLRTTSEPTPSTSEPSSIQLTTLQPIIFPLSLKDKQALATTKSTLTTSDPIVPTTILPIVPPHESLNQPIQPCDSRWTYFDYTNKCYNLIVSNQSITWYEAEKECNNLGGNLASVHGEVESVFLTEWTKTGLVYYFPLKPCAKCFLEQALIFYPYIGLSSTSGTASTRHNSTWTDGSELNFVPVKAFSFVKDDELMCAVQVSDNRYFDTTKISEMQPRYVWMGVHCNSSDRNRFVCKKDANPKLASCNQTVDGTCGHQLVCPPLWTYFEGSQACYQKGYESDYDNAHNICYEQGGKLVVIESQEEQDFVIDFTKIGTPVEDKYNFVWIGGVDIDKQLILGRNAFERKNTAQLLNRNEMVVAFDPTGWQACLALDPDANDDKVFTRKDCSTFMRMYVCKRPAVVN